MSHLHFHVAPVPENTPRGLKEWLTRHFRLVGVNLQNPHPQTIALDQLNAEPERPQDGLIVYADGTNWDPGSGQGIYAYYGSAWVKLG